MNVNDLLRKALNTDTEITAHVPYLASLSHYCTRVAELGVRSGVSTYALLAGSVGNLKKMWSYDWHYREEVVDNCMKAAPEVFSFVKRDTFEKSIDCHVDLLLIDTKHTYGQLEAELDLNAGLVNRWIVMHDTVLYGEKGEAGQIGLLPALRDFLAANKEWFICRHVKNACGLTTISRNEEDRPPSLIVL